MDVFLNDGKSLTQIKPTKNVMDVAPQLKPIVSWKEVWLLLTAAVVAGVIFWFFIAVGLGW